MVEKIIVNPNEIRGYGNILSPHSSTDYELVDCTISSGTDTVNGASATVYTLTSTASHSYSLAFSQDTYYMDFMTGVTVSCTLTNGGVAMSGGTVTFSWNDVLGPMSVTATTNSSGVATHTFDFFDFMGFPVTLTATYNTASTTCTIEEGL